jgi:MSHA biogenesis protein MshK
MTGMMNILLIAMAVAGLGAGLAPATANDSLVGLPDPTRPSSALGDGGGDGVATGVHGLVLQSVLIAPQRRLAVINGKTLAVGERIGEATIVAIRPQDVVLKRPSGEFTLRLVPRFVTRAQNHKAPVSK